MLSRKQIDDPLVVLVDPQEIIETAQQLGEWLEDAAEIIKMTPYSSGGWEQARAWLRGEGE